MNKEELQELKNYHFKKVRIMCQNYIDNEINYKTNLVSDSRLLEIHNLIKNIFKEKERIEELDKILLETEERKK